MLVEYEGEWKNNRRVGVGRCLYSNGDVEAGSYKDVQYGHARPVRVGRGVRWVGKGPAAFSAPACECALSLLTDVAHAGIKVDEKTKFQMLRRVDDATVASTGGGNAKGWENDVVLKLQVLP